MAYIDNVTNILQIQPDGLPTFVRLSQNENGRNLYFQLAGNEIDIPANSTVTISGTKPDGNVYSGTGSISDNTVLIPEMIQMTAVAGTWDAKIHITSGGNTIATGRVRFIVDADTVAPGSVPSSSELEGLVAEAQQYAETARTEAYGSPLTAQTAAGMTDHTRVYVYTGSETGYTAGHWYYWDGTQWADGGIYNSVAVNTDTTLTLSGVAADAKATGDAIEAARVAIDDTLSNTGEAADAKVVGDELADLKSDFTQLTGVTSLYGMPGSDAWTHVGKPTSYMIEVSGNESLILKGNGDRICYYCALTSAPSGASGESLSFSTATGWTGRNTLAATETIQTTLPSDAKYFIFVYIYNNLVMLPDVVSIDGYDYTKNIYDNFNICYSKYDPEVERINNKIADLTSFDNDLIDENSNNLCQYGTLEDKKYYDPSNSGAGETNKFMFSIKGIPLSKLLISSPYLTQRLYTYSSYKVGDNEHAARCVNFYDSQGNWISGETVFSNPNKVKIGSEIPANASTANVTFYYKDSTYPNKPDVYWVYVQRVLDEYNTFNIKNKVLTQSIVDIDKNSHADFLAVRKPTICITLDGNYPRTQDIINIAEAHGYRIGLAPKWNSSFKEYPESENCYYPIEKFIEWQDAGHEIMIHLGFDLPDTGLSDADCINIIKQAYYTSVEMGFSAKGAVASSGQCADRFIPYVDRWFSYASTQPNHSEYLNNRPDLLFSTAQPDRLWRYSMQSSTLDALKDAVDTAITNTGLVIFYGHAQSATGISPNIFEDYDTYGDDPDTAGSTTNLSDTDHFTNANFDALLTYIDSKTANGDCVVNIPYYAINDYFRLRKTDFNW